MAVEYTYDVQREEGERFAREGNFSESMKWFTYAAELGDESRFLLMTARARLLADLIGEDASDLSYMIDSKLSMTQPIKVLKWIDLAIAERDNVLWLASLWNLPGTQEWNEAIINTVRSRLLKWQTRFGERGRQAEVEATQAALEAFSQHTRQPE